MTEPQPRHAPADAATRRKLEALAAETATREALVPPVSLERLRTLAAGLLREAGAPDRWRDYVMVILSNAAWRDAFADVPMNKRLLMLPQCLRHDRDACPAEMDGFGLLCGDCGRCRIGELRAVAEALGYVVLVAEGTTVVTSLIADGQVEAILGVSCMSVLEKVFPYIQAAAIPGIAVPLLTDGCSGTEVDIAGVHEAINLSGDGATRRLDIEAVRREVLGWFSERRLEEMMGEAGGSAERIARDWLLAGGKRWRPLLTACAYQSLRDDERDDLPVELEKTALSVECFHKASLIHDDIEDADDQRYGRETLHKTHGVAVALNAGDLLIGEGYRLLAESGLDAARTARMVRSAAEAHRRLCGGQGDELSWASRPGPLPVEKMLDIFSRKTSPSFYLALHLGAICAGGDREIDPHLRLYSDSVGIAYQIHDDLRDLHSPGGAGDLDANRLSVVLAAAWEHADEQGRTQLEAALRKPASDAGRGREMSRLLNRTRAVHTARQLLQMHKQQAIRSLDGLRCAPLKALLRRLLGKIFGDAEELGWCADHSAANAPLGELGSQQTA